MMGKEAKRLIEVTYLHGITTEAEKTNQGRSQREHTFSKVARRMYGRIVPPSLKVSAANLSNQDSYHKMSLPI